MQRTKIPWATHSWGVVSGCSKGCSYCYARKMATRFGRSFEPTCHSEKLDEPLKLKKPARIFVDSNGDLFDPAIPDEFIVEVWHRMYLAKQHTFIVLTKQAERMLKWWGKNPGKVWCGGILPNVWLGVTAETQKTADERLYWLMQMPARVRFASIEPILGPIDLRNIQIPAGGHVDVLQGAAVYGPNGIEHEKRWQLDWVIVGDDSSPGAKMPFDEWTQKILDQCRAAGVPVFIKGRLAERFPYQEFPEVR